MIKIRTKKIVKKEKIMKIFKMLKIMVTTQENVEVQHINYAIQDIKSKETYL